MLAQHSPLQEDGKRKVEARSIRSVLPPCVVFPPTRSTSRYRLSLYFIFPRVCPASSLGQSRPPLCKAMHSRTPLFSFPPFHSGRIYITDSIFFPFHSTISFLIPMIFRRTSMSALTVCRDCYNNNILLYVCSTAILPSSSFTLVHHDMDSNSTHPQIRVINE